MNLALMAVGVLMIVVLANCTARKPQLTQFQQMSIGGSYKAFKLTNPVTLKPGLHTLTFTDSAIGIYDQNDKLVVQMNRVGYQTKEPTNEPVLVRVCPEGIPSTRDCDESGREISWASNKISRLAKRSK